MLLQKTKQIFALFLKIRGGIDEGKDSDGIAYRLASELATVGVCDAHLEWPEIVPDVISAYNHAKKQLDRYYHGTSYGRFGSKYHDRDLEPLSFVIDAIHGWVRETNAESGG